MRIFARQTSGERVFRWKEQHEQRRGNKKGRGLLRILELFSGPSTGGGAVRQRAQGP